MKSPKEATGPGVFGPPFHDSPRTRDAWKGVCASVLLHVAAGAGMLLAISAMAPSRPPPVIDFTLEGPADAETAAPAPSGKGRRAVASPRPEPSPAVQPMPAPVAPALLPEARPAQSREAAPPPAPSSAPTRQGEMPASATPSATGRSDRAASAPGPGSAPGGSGAVTVSVTVPSGGGSPQGAPSGATTSRATTGTGAGTEGPGEARSRYLGRDYAYIRDAIQHGIAYPAMARKMGWEGKVVIAFLVLSDGSVRDVRVVQGSGHSALDRGAVEAVRRAAPFPRPPAEAEIITPVVYRLD